jgi:pimeloyl-ACP methyl ester carboxylesterase
MENNSLRYKNSDIAWYRFGSGPVTVVCFHGYGEDGTIFQFLSKNAVDQYSFISIDLPFHGKTEWREGFAFDEHDLQQVVEQIVPPGQMIMLMGFSLGGRIALSLYQSIPGRIEKIVLLAPDGLKVNGWYWLATQSRAGNKFFAFTMKRPAWFFFQLKILNKLKLVNSSIFKFVNYYIGDAEVRRLLYARWTSLRKLRPDLKKIKEQVREKKTRIRLLYGQHDRIILPAVGEKFTRGIEKYSILTVIPSGHQVLHEKHAEHILRALQH